MQFLLLIHGDERQQARMTPDELEKQFAAYMSYTKDLSKAGVWLGGEPLKPSDGGAKVTVREGKTRIVDGPFTESKEVLGGFYMVECATRDEAIAWAAKCPGASHGTMEVREVLPIPKPR
jgi:hypothetical protein